jgi:L-asparaginase II
MTGVEPGAFAPIAVTTRSGFRESVHFGAAVGLGADGSIAVSVGDPTVDVYPRSANKPLQADAMLGLGWTPTSEQLALACASHAGTPEHLAVVESTLHAAGLTAADLANTPDFPLDQPAALAVIRAGGEQQSILQNCSGKHAAMVATCVVNGWDTAGYLAFDHPLQQAITARYGVLTGQSDVYVGVDGCGAPTHATTLVGLTRAFAAIAAERGAIWQAMTDHPVLVDGIGRHGTRLSQAVPDLMAKGGAEGIFAAALPDGRAVAVKIADGAYRPAAMVAAAVLARMGVEVDPAVAADPIRGHGSPVGKVEPLV